MSYNYTLKYRTFDQLMAAAKGDFSKYDLNDLISDMDMLKVAQRVNYELGLRINETKEVVLEVEKGRVKLPNNFYTLNFMMLCGKYEAKIYPPQGTHVEERIIDAGPEYQVAPPNVIDVCQDPAPPTECDPCAQCGDPCCQDPCEACSRTAISCSLNCKGETVALVQTLKYETRTYSVLKPIRLIENAQDIDCDCPNLYWTSPFTAWIKDGWLYLNVDGKSMKTAKVYVNYQGMMESDDGQLLVPDHDLINEYYEYAIKQRILENLIMNDEPVTDRKVKLIEERYRVARNAATSVVRTPNFEELRRVWKMNRRAMYSKYYNMFMSFPIQNFNNRRRINMRAWPSE
jgi:hypothetical protein